jgi:RNA polymerase sigma-70 factor (ECF subfamily)
LYLNKYFALVRIFSSSSIRNFFRPHSSFFFRFIFFIIKQDISVFMSLIPLTREPENSADADLENIYPQVYDELRRLATFYMRQERTDHTLQPTALVHEAFLRLAEQEKGVFINRTQFISIAAKMMRRILVNHAVARKRQKREGTFVRITLDRAVDAFAEGELNLLELDEALHNLARLDDRQSRVFELRFFGGLSVEETAEVLGISAATIKREWQIAKMFLQRELYNNRS